MHNAKKPRSALTCVLLALIPYSRQNLLLSFKPNHFFNELERASGYRQGSLRTAYKRGKNRGLIDISNPSKLTKKGLREVQPFIAKKLTNAAKLMVIFDIPEKFASNRTYLRRQLKEWNFRQVQKSVWATDYDYADALVGVISELKLGKYVRLYECSEIFPTD